MWANLRDPWDQYVVDELIRIGASPPLHSLGETREQPRFTQIRCVFVDHRGQLVCDIWLSLGFVYTRYEGHPAVVALR